MRSVITFVLCCVVLGGIVGCHHSSSANPRVITVMRLLDAENTVNAISHGLLEANATLEKVDNIEPGYYAAVHPKLVQLALLNDRANQAVLDAKNGNTAVDWQTAVVAIATAAGNVDTLSAFGFKNPQSQQLAQVGFATLVTALSLAATYGGK